MSSVSKSRRWLWWRESVTDCYLVMNSNASEKGSVAGRDESYRTNIQKSLIVDCSSFPGEFVFWCLIKARRTLRPTWWRRISWVVYSYWCFVLPSGLTRPRYSSVPFASFGALRMIFDLTECGIKSWFPSGIESTEVSAVSGFLLSGCKDTYSPCRIHC